jgi:SAM-dependent methyltransferase
MSQQKNSFLHDWIDKYHRQRGQRALERQLVYQEEKAESIKNNEKQIIPGIIQKGIAARKRLEEIRQISDEARVLEVGSGAHGLIFGFGSKFGIGIDPLAVDYKRLFPIWQKNAQTIAAIGEKLPFPDSAFDVVLSDNVIDHAENPLAIVDEIIRVLKPGGLLYFTVNIHHPIYSVASEAHGLWNAFGIRYELSPFADHTVHLTESRIKEYFSHLPLDIKSEYSSVAQVKADNRTAKTSNTIGRLKKVFFKNALYEVIAVRK